MVLKINEAKTYNRISGVLTLLWIFEVLYFIFWDRMLNISLYLTICLFCILGWTHMNRKFKKCMDEYKKLSEEYENLL